MADTMTPAARSERMSRIRNRDTKVELRVRSLIHRMGYRYRLHRGDLPGRPDIVFSSRRKVIFIHGCFWHRHPCHLGRMPKSRLDFWMSKLESNRIRDETNEALLKELGWDVLTVWECQWADQNTLATRIQNFLGRTREIH